MGVERPVLGFESCELRGDVLAGKVLGDHSLLPPLRDDWDAWRESH